MWLTLILGCAEPDSADANPTGADSDTHPDTELDPDADCDPTTTFPCGDQSCVEGEYCLEYVGGPYGSPTVYSCELAPSGCDCPARCRCLPCTSDGTSRCEDLADGAICTTLGK